MNSVGKILQNHPEWLAVQGIFQTLSTKGHQVYLAGGCVRDALLGKAAQDLDIATDATPEQIEQYFDRTVAVGKSFGVMRVLASNQDIEVATFRRDGEYKDGRHPQSITFSTPEEDARRRDFTVNALFFDLNQQKVLDFVGGLDDLAKKTLRTVGVAEQRFQEDRLRLLRGVRFVAQLGFQLDPQTFKSIQNHAEDIRQVSGERIRDEMDKLLRSNFVAEGLRAMKETALMSTLFPTVTWRDSWDDLGATEFWQRLVLFLGDQRESDLKTIVRQLRLSSKEEKRIWDYWNVTQSPTAFFAQRKGKKRVEAQKPGVCWALWGIARKESGAHRQEAEVLHRQVVEEGSLPEPLLKGADLQGHLSGPAMGVCLNEAYWAQLEEKWEDKQSAFNWLSEYLRKERGT